MDYSVRDAIKLAICRKISELEDSLKELALIDTESIEVYYTANWYDAYYPRCPSGEYSSKTLEECVTWLSKETHPMGYSGCTIRIGMYVDILGEPTVIRSFTNAEKMAYMKRADMDWESFANE